MKLGVATSVTVQSMIILQLEYCKKDDGKHSLFLFLDGIVVMRSSNNTLWRTCKNVITMLLYCSNTARKQLSEVQIGTVLPYLHEGYEDLILKCYGFHFPSSIVWYRMLEFGRIVHYNIEELFGWQACFHSDDLCTQC